MRIAICERSPGGSRINTRLDNPIWSGIKMNIYTASKIPSRGENLGSPEFFALSLSWSHSKAHTHLFQQRESKFGKWCSKQACAITIDSLLCLPGVCALAQWPRRHTRYTYKARRRRQYTHTPCSAQPIWKAIAWHVSNSTQYAAMIASQIDIPRLEMSFPTGAPEKM